MVDGSTYEGSFEKGFKEGFGKIIYKSGNVFEGFFKKGKKEGKGKMTWKHSMADFSQSQFVS